MKLRDQLLLGLSVISLLVLGIGWFSLYLIEGNRAYHDSLQLLYLHSSTAKRELSGYFEATQADLETLAGINIIRGQEAEGFTSYLQANPTTFQFQPGDREQEIISIFNSYRLTHQAINSVYMGRENGSFIRSHPRQQNTQYDPRQRPWYQTGIAGGGRTVLTDPYPSVTEDVINIGIVRALMGSSGQPYGVIGIDITMDNISFILEDAADGQFWFGYFSEDGRSLGVPDQFLPDLPTGDKLQGLLTSPKPQRFILAGGEYLLSSQKISAPPGFMVSAMSTGIIRDKELHALQSGLIPLAISLIVMGILNSLAASKLVTQPLSQLTQSIRQAEHNHSNDVQIPLVKHNQEFKELSAAFREYVQLTKRNQEELRTQSEKLDAHKRILEQEVDDRTIELKRALDQAANSEYRLREILRTAQEGFTIINPFGEVMEANPTFFRILERREEDILGRTLSSFMPRKDAIRWDETLDGGADLRGSFDINFEKPDGTPVPCLLSITPMSTNDGLQLGAFALISDISEIRAREAQVRKAEEQLRLLFESVQEGIIELDIQGRIIFSNPAAQTILGYKSEELEGKRAHELFHHTMPDGSPYPLEQCPVHQTLNTGHIYKNSDEFLWRKDGSPFSAELSSVPLTQEGVQIGVVLLFRDISELIEMTRDFMAILENAGDYLFIKDVQGRYRVVNQQFALLLGFSHWRDVVGKTDFDIFPEEFAKEFWEEDQEVFRTGQPVTDRIHQYIGLAGDSRFEKTSKRPLFDNRGRVLGLFGLSSDVTDLKHLNDELARSMEVAELATKAKSSFLANMSHEIRTPMNAVMGLAHLLGRTKLNKQQRDYAYKITQASQNLLGILNDILDFSKIEAGKLTIESIPFDLQDVVDGLVGVIGLKCQEKNLELILSQSTEVPTKLIGDPLRLNQILLNLCSNAVKFTPDGEVRIEVIVSRFERKRVVLRFSVSDTGIGMDRDQQRRLFTAFNQGDGSITRKYGGTGLGLSIAKRLVEMQGGTIWLDSQEHVGTTFFFTVELGLQSDQTLPDSVDSPRVLRGKRVLVVDDNDAMREVLAHYLEHFGLEVHRGANGQEALAMAAEHPQGYYSIFLVDYHMPELDGLRTIELLRQVGAFDEKGKVILVSTYGDDISEQTIEQGNIHGLITKPVSQSRLFDTLMAIMGEDLQPVTISNDPISSLTSKLSKLGNLRFLLVEDNEINRQVARELLQDEGILVDEAVDGVQAIEAINQAAREMQPYDLVFMDLQMPRMDGYTAVEEIRKDSAFKDLPIIAMTADAMAGVEERVYRSGMDGYITKPIVIEELFRTILHLLDPTGRQGLEEISALPEQNGSMESGAADLEQYLESGSDLLPKLSGIDRAKAIRRLRGNYQLYQRLLKSFYASYHDFSNTYKVLSEEDQTKRKIREIHTLKGILGTLGHQDLQSKAASLNEALISETSTSGQSVLEEQILTGVADFIAEIEPWIQEHDDDTQAEASAVAQPAREKPIATKDTLAAELRALEGLISASDSSALLKARNLQTRLREGSELDPQRELLHQVCEYLENFDFDEANQRLIELLRICGS